MKTAFGIRGVLLLSAAVFGVAADWPRWQGPDGTRISRETGLLKEWPASGPRLIWTATGIGAGYGSMAIAGDRVFLQGARGEESVVIALNRADGKEVWAKVLGPVDDGYLYGFNDSILTCLEFATGKVMWRDRSVGKGSVMFADGHLYIQSENNVVGLAEATPDGYREKGRFEIPEKSQLSWAHPVISDGRLYVRNQDILLVYDIKAAR